MKLKRIITNPWVIAGYTALLVAPHIAGYIIRMNGGINPYAPPAEYMILMLIIVAPHFLLLFLGLYLFFRICGADITGRYWGLFTVLAALLIGIGGWIVPLEIVALGGTATIITLAWHRDGVEIQP